MAQVLASSPKDVLKSFVGVCCPMVAQSVVGLNYTVLQLGDAAAKPVKKFPVCHPKIWG